MTYHEDLLARAAKIKQRYTVAGKDIFPNVYLAPMSGVTDISFRRLVSRLAGGRTGLMVSEFVSVEGITRLNPKCCRQMAFAEEERPFTVQIFGGEPERMAWGAQMVEDCGADFVEINCGCPAPKVVQKGGGSGLLKDLDNLKNIIGKVQKAVKIPVTVKVRIGWSDDCINLPETQRIVEGEGASALVIHGRTRAQGYKGLANWEIMAEAKSRASIPVVGNGDILTVDDVVDKLERWGVDGVAIGRGAMHNPWIFNQVADVYAGIIPKEPTLDEQRDIFRLYAELLREEMDIEMRVLGKLKQMAARTMKCLPNSAKGRTTLLRSQSTDEFFTELDAFFASVVNYRGRVFHEVKELNGKNEPDIVFGDTYKG